MIVFYILCLLLLPNIIEVNFSIHELGSCLLIFIRNSGITTGDLHNTAKDALKTSSTQNEFHSKLLKQCPE